MAVNDEGSTGEGRVWEYEEILAHTTNEMRCPRRQTLTTKTHSALPGPRSAGCVMGEGEPWACSSQHYLLPQNHVYSDTWCHLLNESFLSQHNIIASKIIITAFKNQNLRQMRMFLMEALASSQSIVGVTLNRVQVLPSASERRLPQGDRLPQNSKVKISFSTYLSGLNLRKI